MQCIIQNSGKTPVRNTLGPIFISQDYIYNTYDLRHIHLNILLSWQRCHKIGYNFTQKRFASLNMYSTL